MRPISSRERRLIAVLLLLAALVLAHLLVVAPIVDGFQSRAERKEMLTRQFQANQRLADSIPRLRGWAEQQRAALRDFILPAPDPAAASAMLQERLQDGIEAVGGELRAIEEVTSESGLVRVRGSARVTLDQLTALLARLQTRPPYLNIESLSITADQALISGRLEPLDVTFETSVPTGPATA